MYTQPNTYDATVTAEAGPEVRVALSPASAQTLVDDIEWLYDEMRMHVDMASRLLELAGLIRRAMSDPT